MTLLQVGRQEFPELKMTYLAALIPTGVAMNFAGFAIRQAFGVPLFLNTGGIILVGLIAGPWPAATVGLLTALVNGIVFNPVQAIPFISIVAGLIVGYMAQYGFSRTWLGILLMALALAAGLSVASAIQYTILAGGFTGTAVDVLTAVIMKASGKVVASVFTAHFFSSIIDKAILFAIDLAILKALPPQYRRLTPMYAGMETE
ncbi:MAG: hypothetical protein ACM3ZU_11400 [Bacteroidota bacterium]